MYGNLMVDVKTGSEKLKDRARRIVAIVTGVDADEAGARLTAPRQVERQGGHRHGKGQASPIAQAGDCGCLKKADDSIRAALGEDHPQGHRAAPKSRRPRIPSPIASPARGADNPVRCDSPGPRGVHCL